MPTERAKEKERERERESGYSRAYVGSRVLGGFWFYFVRITIAGF